MRLIFLCSGLEAERDGVADYTKVLARQCAAAGHDVRLASLRDALALENARSNGNEFRQRDIFNDPSQAHALADWLKDFQPDWASVQFTPFGFHPRGLGRSHAALLRGLLPAKTRRHIMLHEIWLQPGSDGTWRHRALGWWQRRSVDAWIKTGWQPEVIHTQARLHRARLEARGVSVGLLPLCSNFSACEKTFAKARQDVAEWLFAKGQTVDQSAHWIGHFGALHTAGWDFPTFAAQVALPPGMSKKRVCFLALGRSAAAADMFAKAQQLVPQADFKVLGELPADKVCVAMEACDAAFTSTPWDIMEKSSTVAAWRKLGVPVLVTRTGAVSAASLPPWPDPGFFLAHGPNSYCSANIFKRIPGPAYLDSAYTAQAFLSALENVPACPA